MFHWLPRVLRTPLVIALIALSTVVHTLPLFLVAFLKWSLHRAGHSLK